MRRHEVAGRVLGPGERAYAFVFFTGTVLYALVESTADWAELVARLGPWIAVQSALMVVARLAFGAAVVRAGVFPRWTGRTLVAGMVLGRRRRSAPARPGSTWPRCGGLAVTRPVPRPCCARWSPGASGPPPLARAA